ncbi:Signal peptide peptidase-like 3 [Liparis tanakae]|uniref:Signal peptide peptidase-like 3 n=1 Tax=Liparis tanakae TaxID=230148 RepID=A0A4Z2I0M1_9TELE|nr:Signal peptide peptidase-like 3 [Liparis tanakae]
MAEQGYSSWAYSLVDSSQVSTFLISILLIVYGSFRSLNMDCENQEKDKDGNPMPGFNNGTNNSIQTIDSTQALFLPIGASVSLLVMFFFFDSVQVVFTICTAVLATIAFAFLLLPMCQYMTRPCSPQNKISFGCCGRFTLAELLSFAFSVLLVLIWVLTGHWLLMDALAMGLCVAMIAFVRLPSLKVSCLLLSGLLIYDVFWVFFSAYIFNSNVMVKVATQPAENPIDVLSRKLHLGPGMGRDVPRLSLPGKLVFPSSTGSHFSMLGIGDIVMPGLLLCFVLRYDNYKKQANGEVPLSGRMQRVSYFHCTLIGYFVGLLTATVASRIHRAAQPALLYLVPFTLLPLLTMAYLKGDLRRMWSEPFHTKTSSSRFLEKDSSVWITTPQHDSLSVPTSSLCHRHFLFSVYFLFIRAHPAYAVFVPPPPLALSFFLFLCSIVSLGCHFPPEAAPMRQASSRCVFLLSRSFFFSASLFVTDSDELEGQASPPFCGLRVNDLNKLRRGGALQWHRTALGSSATVKKKSPPLHPTPSSSPCFLHLSRHGGSALRHSLRAPPSSPLFICCPHSPPSQITMYFI